MQNNSQRSRGKGNISTLSFGNNVFELKKKHSKKYYFNKSS